MSPSRFKRRRRVSQPIYHVIVLGESGVGKTSLVDRVIFDKQYALYDPFGSTLSPHLRSCKLLEVDGVHHWLELHDVSLTPLRVPEPGFRSDFFDHLLETADGVVLMYDVTDQKSYDAVTEEGWMYVWNCRREAAGVAKYPSGSQRFGCVLVGNKIDLVQGEASERREISASIAEEWGSMVGVKAFEVDRFNKGVLEDVLVALVRDIKRARRRDNEDIEMVQGKEPPPAEPKGTSFLSLRRLRNALLSVRSKSETGT